jgi:hypothetical protein
MRKLLLVSVAAILMLPAIGAARGRVGVFVGPGFAPYGWYDPAYGFTRGVRTAVRMQAR